MWRLSTTQTRYLPGEDILWSLQNSQKWKIISQLLCKEDLTYVKTESTQSSWGSCIGKTLETGQQKSRKQRMQVTTNDHGQCHNYIQVKTLFVHTRINYVTEKQRVVGGWYTQHLIYITVFRRQSINPTIVSQPLLAMPFSLPPPSLHVSCSQKAFRPGTYQH